MNTNEIPIKLPERYTRGDDRFHVIHEDDINDDSKEGEKNIPLIVLSFFLSFFRAYEFRRSAKRISAGKQNRTRNVSVYEDSRLCVFLSLFWSLSSRQNGKALSIVSLVLANVAPRHARVVPDACLSYSQLTCVLKYLIEHNILNRNKRSVGRGDETHHETDQRNEPV